MKSKGLKRMIAVAFVFTALFTTVASAKSFTNNGRSIYYNLTASWSWDGNDKGTALTQPEDGGRMENGNKVATYLEYTKGNSSTVMESTYDHGYYWAQGEFAKPGVYRFNSTHGVVHEGNVWKWLDTRMETNW